MYQPVFAQLSFGFCLLIWESHTWAPLFCSTCISNLTLPLLAILMHWILGEQVYHQTWVLANLTFQHHLHFMLHHNKLCLLYNKYYLYHVVLFIYRKRFSLNQRKKFVGFWLNGEWIPCFGYYITSHWNSNAGSWLLSHSHRHICSISKSRWLCLPWTQNPTASSHSHATIWVQANFLPRLDYWSLQQPPNWLVPFHLPLSP